MTARKLRETAGAGVVRPSHREPPYHSDISDDYLVALQRQIDAKKPEGFRLTPIGEAGW